MENDPEIKKQLEDQVNTLEWSVLKKTGHGDRGFAGVMGFFLIRCNIRVHFYDSALCCFW